MTAEKYLQSARTLKFKIDKCEQMRKNIHLDVNYISGSNIEGDRIQSSPRTDRLEDAAIKCLEKVKKIDIKLVKLRTDYIELRTNIYEIIMDLNEGQCQRFLVDYYIDCKSIKQFEKMYKKR